MFSRICKTGQSFKKDIKGTAGAEKKKEIIEKSKILINVDLKDSKFTIHNVIFTSAHSDTMDSVLVKHLCYFFKLAP